MIVPIVALAAVLLSRPSHRLSAGAHGKPEVRWLIDDFDAAGRILRGLNANAGRLAGRTSEPPGVECDRFLKVDVDLEPRYFLEYPQAALLIFQAVDWFSNPYEAAIPNALLDSLYHNITYHAPQGDIEIRIWSSFSRMAATYNVLFCLALLLMMYLLRDHPIVLLALPGSVYFALHRYDILPSLAVVLAIMAAERKKPFLAGSWLGFAVMLKAYPLILAPIILRYIATDIRKAIVYMIGMAWPIATLLGYALYQGDWQAMIEPYRFQLSRRPEPESALYGNLLPLWLGGSGLAGLIRNSIILLTVMLMCLHRACGLNDLLRRCALAVMLFTALQVFYSQQWLLWLIPLLIPLAGSNNRLFGLLIALDLANYLSFPIIYDLSAMMNLEMLRLPMIVIRVVIWGAIAVELLRMRIG